MKKVITYGTFDLLHIGHINLLKRAKALGDYLIVSVSTDKFNEVKGKKTILPYEQRVEIVKSLKFVDEVIPEKTWEQKIEDVKKHDIDVFTIGKDWEGKFDFLKKHCEVIYLERTENISSTKLKNDLDKLNALHNLLENLSKEDIDYLLNILEKISNLK
ncbi:MAG: glycerol-3-phosphate cytidylyltransferase [Candidatus Woesearchaeota archaeon]